MLSNISASSIPSRIFKFNDFAILKNITLLIKTGVKQSFSTSKLLEPTTTRCFLLFISIIANRNCVILMEYSNLLLFKSANSSSLICITCFTGTLKAESGLQDLQYVSKVSFI